jgi:hypothetical protein
MGKATGFVLIVVGLLGGAYALLSPAEYKAPDTDFPEIALPVGPSGGAFVPAGEPARETAAAESTAERASKPSDRSWQATVEPAARPAAPAPRGSVVVTLAQRHAEVPTRTPVGTQLNAAAIPADKVSLARELQRELRRVGCYDGEITGAWTTSTRRAMKVFTDRINATLPTDEPDYVLLSLVRSHPNAVCGSGCPDGQRLGGSGRCIPAALVANAKRPAQRAADGPEPVITGWSTSATAGATNLPSPADGRMALAGPKAESGARPDDGPRLTAAPSPRIEADDDQPPPSARSYTSRRTGRSNRATRQPSWTRNVFRFQPF